MNESLFTSKIIFGTYGTLSKPCTGSGICSSDGASGGVDIYFSYTDYAGAGVNVFTMTFNYNQAESECNFRPNTADNSYTFDSETGTTPIPAAWGVPEGYEIPAGFQAVYIPPTDHSQGNCMLVIIQSNIPG
jgi:hypothetical protein